MQNGGEPGDNRGWNIIRQETAAAKQMWLCKSGASPRMGRKRWVGEILRGDLLKCCDRLDIDGEERRSQVCFKVAFCRTGKKNCWCQNETSGKPECSGGFFEFRGTAMKTVRQCGALWVYRKRIIWIMTKKSLVKPWERMTFTEKRRGEAEGEEIGARSSRSILWETESRKGSLERRKRWSWRALGSREIHGFWSKSELFNERWI